MVLARLVASCLTWPTPSVTEELSSFIGETVPV
jgi:hypothetical protein